MTARCVVYHPAYLTARAVLTYRRLLLRARPVQTRPQMADGRIKVDAAGFFDVRPEVNLQPARGHDYRTDSKRLMVTNDAAALHHKIFTLSFFRGKLFIDYVLADTVETNSDTHRWSRQVFREHSGVRTTLVKIG